MIKRLFTREPTAALGEMLMIIFGILIALQIDNWNENRKERELRYNALEEVQVALRADLRHIDYPNRKGHRYCAISGLAVRRAGRSDALR